MKNLIESVLVAALLALYTLLAIAAMAAPVLLGVLMFSAARWLWTH